MSERGGALSRTDAPPASSGSCCDNNILFFALGVGILLGGIPGIPARRPPCPHRTTKLFSTTVRVRMWAHGRGRPASLGKELARGEASRSHFLSSAPPHRFSTLDGSRAAARATATRLTADKNEFAPAPRAAQVGHSRFSSSPKKSPKSPAADENQVDLSHFRLDLGLK